VRLPDPDVLAQKMVEHIVAAVEQFREIAADLEKNNGSKASGARNPKLDIKSPLDYKPK
jgi:hypothetical protein